LKNLEVFQKDPNTFNLINNGVSKVGEIQDDKDRIKTLRFELETFVCEGEYAKGLERILSGFLGGLSKPEQQAVWVSGFYGSGKSHLVKMLRYLWDDYTFEDGASASSLVTLQQDIKDQFVELKTQGRKYGGLKAVSGTLSEGSPENVRIAFLQILFRAQGLPEKYSSAKFVLWLKREKLYESIVRHLKQEGHDPDEELKNLYVSTHLAEAMLNANPTYGSIQEVLSSIKENFPAKDQPTIKDVIEVVQQIFSNEDGELPLTLIVIDEVQQYIHDKVKRAMDVQEIAEKCCRDLDSKVLLVGTGQSALTGTPILQRLQARFTIKVPLTDSDVENVIRNTILAKKPERNDDIKKIIRENQGEISRHLQNSRIASNSNDEKDYHLDYPLLPVRRRFWEKVLRNVDESGMVAQLRTQLRIVFDATKDTADKELGTVIPADYIYDQISPDLLNTGVLQREYHEIIMSLRDNTPEGQQKSRICAIIFLISQLPKTPGANDGVLSNQENIADLLVEDLKNDGARLRYQIPKLLDELVSSGKIMSVGNEYCLQTKEGASWNHDYNLKRTKILNDDTTIGMERDELLNKSLTEILHGITITQGSSKQSRDLKITLSNSKPENEKELILWIRHGWSEDEKTVISDAQAAGSDCPIIFGMLPRLSHEDLKKSIASYLAAKQTLAGHGTPTTPEAITASKAVETHLKTAELGMKKCIQQIISHSKIFLGGGNEVNGLSLNEKVKNAADDALLRLYPKFNDADHANWSQVLTKARNGDLGALSSVGYKGDVLSHPVCKQIYNYVNPSKTGKDVRNNFMAPHFGWPKDAIDASLVIITLSGNLRASINGKNVHAKDLNQSQMGKYQFTVDVPPLSAAQRLDLKALFKKINIDLTPGQDSFAAMNFLKDLIELADSIGGDTPLPEVPDVSLIKDLQSYSGNEQLLQIYNNRDDIEKMIKDWRKIKDILLKKMPRWNRLEELFSLSEGIEGREDIQDSIAAISSNRSILDHPDQIEPLIQKVLHELRTILNALHSEMENIHSTEMKSLEGHQTWKKLSSQQKSTLVEKNQLDSPKSINVKTEDDILDLLQANSIVNRQTQIVALPQRFQRALEEAAILLEPKAIRIVLPSTTIKNEDELDEWIEEVRERIRKQLKDGPAII
jgi:hypothetical protein